MTGFLLVPVVAAFPVVLWVLVTYTLAQLSGWPTLVTRFRAEQAPPGERVWGQVKGVGSVPENNVTTLVIGPQGLYLSRMILFRLGCPPLLVPWDQVAFESERPSLFVKLYALRLGGDTRLTVKERAWREIAPYLSPVSETAAAIRPR